MNIASKSRYLTTVLVVLISACSTQEQTSKINLVNTSINKQTLKSQPQSVTPSTSQISASGTLVPQPPLEAPTTSVLENKDSASQTAASPKTEYLTQNQPVYEGERQAPNRARIARKFVAKESDKLQSNIFPFIPHIPVADSIEQDKYQHLAVNTIHLAAERPVSTFSIDVDTGSYTHVRRILRDGRLPVKDAVRIEEFINYFSYDYPKPDDRQRPFNITTEIGPNPWNSATQLLHIGINAYDISQQELPASNLIFLIDVSGSMHNVDKLPLLKNAFSLLVNKLRQQDKVAIVVYAGASGVALKPTRGNRKAEILAAIQNLSVGGSTNGASGIRLAYQLARQSFIKDGINRVILATDGDFNVGTVNLEALKDLIENQRSTGISLTTLGFGSGNYNDVLMEQLADVGNGNYAYIDSLLEAQKSLVDQLGATLLTVAKDVKIQIEFNPAVVAEYRLVGYENRLLNREDFNNDKVDAGDIGAGHTVTALYEISLVDSKLKRITPLRYPSMQNVSTSADASELAFLKIRYKQPDSDKSLLISQAIKTRSMQTTIATTTARFRFSASVAAFAQILRGGRYIEDLDYARLLKLAQQSKGTDPDGYRGEFINLLKLANSLQISNTISLRQ